MKKGNSKKRHRSNGIRSFKKHKFSKFNNGGNRYSDANLKPHQFEEMSFKWRRIEVVIQILDFLVDKLPRLFRIILNLFGGMG